ncbi:MAG: 16S rRNA (adenine(1518)-N(6)/adenine(1519)-N(6))-dimethyltransferase RsmA, partial [Lactobacillus sp.]|nr:16S rRNA (adenine(1518)-N(6)/adenine(1519)-N(6))-dimethyltransferase RsmA [Lactobacillus sp.]
MTQIPNRTKLRTTPIINKYLMRAKKALGQNFLIDSTVLSGIVTAADITAGDQVIEIGPGIGSLTEQLLVAGAKVLAYEVDTDLEPILMSELPAKIAGQPLAARYKLLLK